MQQLSCKILNIAQLHGAKSAIFLTPLFLELFMANEFVMSPEPFIQKCKNLAKSKDLYVEVEEGSISLAWTAFSEDGSTNKVEYFYRAEAVRLGISWRGRTSKH